MSHLLIPAAQWRNPARAGALEQTGFDGSGGTTIVGHEQARSITPAIPLTAPIYLSETQGSPTNDTSGDLIQLNAANPPVDFWTDAGLKQHVWVQARSTGGTVNFAIYKNDVQLTTPVSITHTDWRPVKVGTFIYDAWRLIPLGQFPEPINAIDVFTLRVWGAGAHLGPMASLPRVVELEAETYPNLTYTNIIGDSSASGGSAVDTDPVAMGFGTDRECFVIPDLINTIYGFAVTGSAERIFSHLLSRAPAGPDHPNLPVAANADSGVSVQPYKNGVATGTRFYGTNFFRTWWLDQWPGDDDLPGVASTLGHTSMVGTDDLQIHHTMGGGPGDEAAARSDQILISRLVPAPVFTITGFATTIPTGGSGTYTWTSASNRLDHVDGLFVDNTGEFVITRATRTSPWVVNHSQFPYDDVFYLFLLGVLADGSYEYQFLAVTVGTPARHLLPLTGAGRG
jgi:hypothetical protein